MNLLIEQAAETDGIQSNAPLFRPDVWRDVELRALHRNATRHTIGVTA